MTFYLLLLLLSARSYSLHLNGAGGQPVEAEFEIVTAPVQITNSILELVRFVDLPFPKILHVCTRYGLGQAWTSQWEGLNSGWRVDVLDDHRVRELLDKSSQHFGEMWRGGPRHDRLFDVEATDIGRLLALEMDGGIYVDDDVQPKQPIRLWMSRFGQPEDIDLLLGVEFPRPPGERKEPVQITNFALGSKPHNPVIRFALDQILRNVKETTSTKSEIIYRTGPVALTEAIFKYLRDAGATIPETSVFNGGEGHLFRIAGNGAEKEQRIVLLPYRAFGFHPRHGSDVVKTPLADHLVEHLHRNTWHG